MREWDKKFKVEVLRDDGKWIKQLETKNYSVKRIKEMVKQMDGSYDYAFKENSPKARITKIMRSKK